MLELIKVSSNTSQSKLAGAICAAIRENGTTLVSCVGFRSLVQSVRGLSIARRFLSEEGIEIYTDIEVENNVVVKNKDGEESGEHQEVYKFKVLSRKVEK